MTSPQAFELSALPHLCEGSWIDFELKSAQALVGSMAAEVSKLEDKVLPERVHKTRVSLRRWFSVWSILEEDGWTRGSFTRDVLKPLRKTLKHLGAVRDFDVNMELAEKYECSVSVRKYLKKGRKRARKKLEKLLDKLNIGKLIGKIEPYLETTSKELAGKVSSSQESPFARFDIHVKNQEELVRRLNQTAKSPDELHELRLGIKKWRYLLTECLGVTNLDLVASQTVLGEIHDIDRLLELLYSEFRKEKRIAALEATRKELVERFQATRSNFPYGLRPGITSLKG